MMDLISEYIEAILEIDDINKHHYTNASVKRNNKLADKIRNIAFAIEKNHPELKEDFYRLLFCENDSVRIWTAHHILEVMNYEDECRKNALKEIHYAAEKCSGNKLWLKNWYSDHPEDKKLL